MEILHQGTQPSMAIFRKYLSNLTRSKPADRVMRQVAVQEIKEGVLVGAVAARAVVDSIREMVEQTVAVNNQWLG